MGDLVGQREAKYSPIVMDVQAILAGRKEVRLLHRDEEYRLRVTKQGKLILTK